MQFYLGVILTAQVSEVYWSNYNARITQRMNILASLNSERETERKGQPAGVRYGAVHLIMSKGPVKL